MKVFGATLVAGCAALLAALIVVPWLSGPGLARAVGNAFLEEGSPGGWAGGGMEVSLWPRPVVAFRDARFGAAGDPWLRADRVEARVALPRLLLGRIAFEQVRFAGAELRLDGAAALGGLPQVVRRAREVRVDGARVRLAREGRPLEAARLLVRRLEGDSMYLEAEAPGAAGAPLAFEGVAGPGADGGPPRLRAALAHGGMRWTYAGTFDLAALAEGGRPLGEGEVRLEAPDAGALLPGAPAAPLAAAGSLTLRPGAAGLGAEVADLALRAGALEMRGALEVAPGDGRPAASFSLSARSADLDALPGGPGALRALAAAAGARLAGLDAEALLAVGTLRAGGQAVRDASVRLVAGDGRVRVDRLEARLPGGTDLALAGERDAAPDGALFHGRASLAARDLRAFAGWLGRDLAVFPAGRLRSLEVEGALTVLGDGWRLADAEGAVDSQRFRGTIARPSGEGGRIELALALPRLDPGAFAAGAPAGGAAAAAGALALLGLLPEEGAEVELSVAELRVGEAALAGVTLRGGTGGGEAVLRRLRIADFAGAAFEMEGAVPLPPSGGPVEARIEVASGDARALAGALGIGAAAAAAPPFGADGVLEVRGGPARFDVALAGEAFGSRLSAEGSVGDPLGEPSVDLEVRVRGAGAEGEAFEIAGKVAGTAGGLALRGLRLAASGIEGAAEGVLSLAGARPRLDADLDLRRIAGVLPLPSPPRPGGRAGGPPAWARLGLPGPLLAGVDADLRIRADAVDLGGGRVAGDARGVLALRAGEAALRGVRARLGEGWLRAEGAFRSGPGAGADLELRLSNAEVGALRAGTGFAVEGTRVSGVMRLRASGASGPAMAQTLSGTGWIALREGVVRGLGPGGGDGAPPLALHRARSGFTVRDGIVLLEEGTAEIGGWSGGMAGEVSVVDRTADVTLLLRPRAGSGGERSTARIRGPWRELRGRLAAAGGPDR